MMATKGRIIAAVCAGVILLVSGLATGCAEAGPAGSTPEEGGEVIEWTLDTYFPLGIYISAGVEEFCDRVNERAEGGFVITAVFGSALGVKGPDVATALGSGTFEADFTAFPYLSGDIPVLGIAGLPTLFKSNFEGFGAHYILTPYYRSELLQRNVRQVGGIWFFPKQCMWSKEPIKTVEDLDGKTFRGFSPEATMLLDELGVNVISMAMPEVYTALQRGMLDAIVGSTASAQAVSAWEVLDYGIDVTFSLADSGFIVNNDAWEALPARYQVILTEEADRLAAIANSQAITEEEAGWADLASKGITRITPEPSLAEDMAAAAAPIWDTWGEEKGGTAAEALDKVRALLGR